MDHRGEYIALVIDDGWPWVQYRHTGDQAGLGQAPIEDVRIGDLREAELKRTRDRGGKGTLSPLPHTPGIPDGLPSAALAKSQQVPRKSRHVRGKDGRFVRKNDGGGDESMAGESALHNSYRIPPQAGRKQQIKGAGASKRPSPAPSSQQFNQHQQQQPQGMVTRRKRRVKRRFPWRIHAAPAAVKEDLSILRRMCPPPPRRTHLQPPHEADQEESEEGSDQARSLRPPLIRVHRGESSSPDMKGDSIGRFIRNVREAHAVRFRQRSFNSDYELAVAMEDRRMQDMQGDLQDAKMVSKSEGDAAEEEDQGGMEGVDMGDHPKREPPSRASEEELQAIAALATVRKAARVERAWRLGLDPNEQSSPSKSDRMKTVLDAHYELSGVKRHPLAPSRPSPSAAADDDESPMYQDITTFEQLYAMEDLSSDEGAKRRRRKKRARARGDHEDDGDFVLEDIDPDDLRRAGRKKRREDNSKFLSQLGDEEMIERFVEEATKILRKAHKKQHGKKARVRGEDGTFRRADNGKKEKRRTKKPEPPLTWLETRFDASFKPSVTAFLRYNKQGVGVACRQTDRDTYIHTQSGRHESVDSWCCAVSVPFRRELAQYLVRVFET